MSDPDEDVQSWFDEMPDQVRDYMSQELQDAANRLAGAIKNAAPQGPTGNLKESVQVRETDDGYEVTAGGDLTTKYYDRSTGYEREVIIDGRDNSGIAKAAGGAGVSYDYALAVEFGTHEMNAEPFFFNTALRVEPQLRDEIEDAIGDALSS